LVKVRADGFTVQARRGYFAPQAAEKQISRIVFAPHGTISALTPVKSRYRRCEVALHLFEYGVNQMG
jgi:hypothetical protein